MVENAKIQKIECDILSNFGQKNATFLEDFPNYLLGSLEPMCAWKIIRKWLECYLWHIFFQKESRQAADCDCNQKFPEGKKGFEHQKLVVVVGMKAFIRRECRDHPIRDSTQISPTTRLKLCMAWKGAFTTDWLHTACCWEEGCCSAMLSFLSVLSNSFESWMPKEDFPSLSFEACYH